MMEDNPYRTPSPVEAALVDDVGLNDSPRTVQHAAMLLRGLLLFYAILVIATIASSVLMATYLPVELQRFTEQEPVGFSLSVLLVGVVIAIPTLLIMLAGWLGMFFYWRTARWMFFASQLLILAVAAVFGPYVTHGVEEMFDAAGQFVAGAIVALAYYSPARVLFEKTASNSKVR
jgi:hypothetical protein